ncbi:hypothetical protein JCM11251_002728 [Rhodosporidiobolus azoricus]
MVLPIFSRQKDVLSVHFLEDVVYIHPPPHRPHLSSGHDLAAHEPTAHDQILRGQVTLVCNAPRKARKVEVRLVGICTRHGGDGSHSYEQGNTLEKVLEIDLGSERLEAGTHTWDFSFIIPSSTAVTERSTYGVVRHTVRATLVGIGNIRDLQSTIKQVFFIANPAPPGELPSGLEIDVRHAASELGPIALHISSPHLTVASLLFMGITFEQPPDGLKIMSVQSFVRQEFEIHYSNKEVPVQRPPVQRKLLFYVDSTTPIASSAEDLLDRSNLSRGAPPPLAYEPRALMPHPLARLEGGKEWMYARVTRIPDDDSVRPTTLEGTDSPIRVSHSIVLQVKYRFKGSKKDQVLEMASNVTIASCCCLNSSLLLPVYRSYSKQCYPSPGHPRSASMTPNMSATSSSSSTPQTGRSRSNSLSAQDALSAAAGGVPIGIDSPSGTITPFHRRCLCNTPLHQLVQAEGEKLAGAAESRSRSRMAGGAEASASRSRNRLGRQGRGERHEGEGEGMGGGDDSDEDARGRDARRRKVGETYEVPADPAPYGIEELPSCASSAAAYVPVRSSGGTWAAQGDLLQPARRPVMRTQGGTSLQSVGAARGGGAAYIVV